MSCILAFSLHPWSHKHTDHLGPRLASHLRFFGPLPSRQPGNNSCGEMLIWLHLLTSLILLHLTLFKIFQDLVGLLWSRYGLRFPLQTWLIGWLFLYPFHEQFSPRAWKHAYVLLCSLWRSRELRGTNNYLESSYILRCWGQLFLGPRRQITTIMPTKFHTCNFFLAKMD